jgi:hypothetical protein
MKAEVARVKKKIMDTDKIQGEYGESIYSISATMKSIPNWRENVPSYLSFCYFMLVATTILVLLKDEVKN